MGRVSRERGAVGYRILFVDLGAVWGGQEIYSLNLMSALRAKGHFVISVSSNDKHRCAADKFYTVDLAYTSFIGLSKLIKKLVVLYRIDVVHVNGNRAMYLAALLRLSARLVATKHLPFYSGDAKPLKQRLARLASSVIFKLFDHIVCVARATFDDLPNGCKEFASVIPNGVPDKRSTVTNNRQGDDHVNMCYVARLVEHKGILPLMRGVISAAERGANCHLSIAGDGPLRAEVELLVNAHPQLFCYNGFVLDPSNVYNQSDICCLPSLSEGMPLNILEAFSCGLPVLAVDISGVNEVVNDNNGWLLRDNSMMAIADEIMSICQQTRSILQKSKQARLDYESCYSVELMASRTLEVYSER